MESRSSGISGARRPGSTLPSGRSVSSSTLSLHDERLVTYHAEASGQAFAKSGSTADTAAGGPLDGVMVTILNADKRIARMCSRRWRNDMGLRWTAVTID